MLRVWLSGSCKSSSLMSCLVRLGRLVNHCISAWPTKSAFIDRFDWSWERASGYGAPTILAISRATCSERDKALDWASICSSALSADHIASC